MQRDPVVSAQAAGRDHSSRLFNQVWLLVIFFLTATASLNGFYEKWNSILLPGTSPHGSAQFDLMVDGRLSRPYVYRRLLPDIANLTDRATPVAWKDWLVIPQPPKPSRVALILNPSIAASEVYAFRFLVVYLSTLLFAVLALYAMYWACIELSFPPLASVGAAMFVMLLLPYLMNMGGYFYDYSELAFLALAAWMALRFDWWWLIPVAALATWNKESFLFFVPTLYPMFRLRRSRLSATLGVVVLGAVCASLYLVVRSHFAHNPGSAIQHHLHQQVHFFTNMHSLFLATDKTYGITTLSAATVFPTAFVAWTVWRAWPRLPAVVRSHAQIAAAINIPLFLLFCAPGELRDLSLLYVTFLIVLATTFTAQYGSRVPLRD